MESNISGFHRLGPGQRMAKIREMAKLTDEEVSHLESTGRLSLDRADRMIENVIGTAELPFAVATNFCINGRDILVPMVTEEPSVVAAASYAAKLARPDGFSASSDESVMVGQIQMVNVADPEEAQQSVHAIRGKLLDAANSKDPMLQKYGGGAKDVETRVLDTAQGKMLIVHLIVNVADAMGANAVNTMSEAVAPMLESATGGKARLRIISNLADRRLARATAVWRKDVLGEDTIQGILEAYAFADADPYRCATHNKGAMNGIDAVVIATGNDFRAVEAGCHCFASCTGRYRSLTRYARNKDGDLEGNIEIPLALGTIGGAIRSNPTASVALKIMGVRGSRELAQVVASVGLAQNFAALRALATEGIQKGHMKLHARNIAVMAGASGKDIDEIAERMSDEGDIRVDRAKEMLGSRNNNKSPSDT